MLDSFHSRVVVLAPNGSQFHSFTDVFSEELYGVAVDDLGSIYVADYGNARVVMLAANGTQLHSFTDGFDDAAGLTVDEMGNICVCDWQHARGGTSCERHSAVQLHGRLFSTARRGVRQQGQHLRG